MSESDQRQILETVSPDSKEELKSQEQRGGDLCYGKSQEQSRGLRTQSIFWAARLVLKPAYGCMQM
jgi:hypothetical protein